jgi:hypothetical protein
MGTNEMELLFLPSRCLSGWKGTGANLTSKLIDVVDDMSANVSGSVDVNCLTRIVGKLAFFLGSTSRYTNSIFIACSQYRRIVFAFSQIASVSLTSICVSPATARLRATPTRSKLASNRMEREADVEMPCCFGRIAAV